MVASHQFSFGDAEGFGFTRKGFEQSRARKGAVEGSQRVGEAHQDPSLLLIAGFLSRDRLRNPRSLH